MQDYLCCARCHHKGPYEKEAKETQKKRSCDDRTERVVATSQGTQAAARAERGKNRFSFRALEGSVPY